MIRTRSEGFEKAPGGDTKTPTGPMPMRFTKCPAFVAKLQALHSSTMLATLIPTERARLWGHLGSRLRATGVSAASAASAGFQRLLIYLVNKTRTAKSTAATPSAIPAASSWVLH